MTYQAESITYSNGSGDPLWEQTIDSTHRIVYFGSNAVGDNLTFDVRVPEEGAYAVKVVYKTERDRGRVQLAVRGVATDTYDGRYVNHGGSQDLYSSSSTFRTVTMADVTFGTAGMKQFRFTVAGKNEASSGYKIAIDSIQLVGLTSPSAVPAATRDLRIYPFSSTAFSNTAMGSGAQFGSSSDARNVTLRQQQPGINRTKWSISVQQAYSTSPLVSVSGVQLRLPNGATTTEGTDQHMSIIQPDRTTNWEAWGMQQQSSTQWTARTLVKVNLRGDGREAGARASGISQLHGLIRAREVSDLRIRHTLAIGIPNSALKSVNGVGVWPAVREDTDGKSAYTGTIPMGSMFAIPPSVDLDSLGLSPQGKALGVALQDYGAHVLVRSGGVTLFAEPSASQSGIDAMARDWVKLRDYLRVVTNNRADNVSGGGTRRQPALPPGY